MHFRNIPWYKIEFIRSINIYNYYKYGALVSLSHTKTYYTGMNIIWHVTIVYFNGAKSSVEFKNNEYTPFEDLKYFLQNILP